MKNAIQTTLVSLLLATSVQAADSVLPIGSLTSENNVTIATDIGVTSISGDYAFMSGDVVNTKDGAVAVLSLDGGSIYVSPSSEAKIEAVDGKYMVSVTSGSVGFNFESDVDFSIVSPDQVISALDGAASGAVAVNANGETVVQAISSALNVVSAEGLQHQVVAGQHWSESEGAQVILAQDVDEDDDDDSAWWLWALGIVGAVTIVDHIHDDHIHDDHDHGHVHVNDHVHDENGVTGAGTTTGNGQTGLDCRDFGTCPSSVVSPTHGPSGPVSRSS